MHIELALQKFVVQLDADGRSRHTIGQYRRHVRLLVRWAADVGHGCEIEAFTHESLAAFLASPVARTRPGGGLKMASSVNCLRASTRGFFAYLISTADTLRSCPIKNGMFGGIGFRATP